MHHECCIRAYMDVFTLCFSVQHTNPLTNSSIAVRLGLEPYTAWMLHQSLHGCIHGEFQTQPHSPAFSF